MREIIFGKRDRPSVDRSMYQEHKDQLRQAVGELHDAVEKVSYGTDDFARTRQRLDELVRGIRQLS